MHDKLLRLYHHLPPPVRPFVATLRGYFLRGWRYGRETDRLIEEARERERWPAERWREWQEGQLALLLRRAAERVPFYREQWAARRRRGDRSSPEYLEHWPILEKEPVRATPAAFVADDRDHRRMLAEHTSGTTGKSITLYRTRETDRRLYALAALRRRDWYGVSRADRWAMVGGRLVTPVAQRRPPFWVWNRAMRQLYMSSYHLAPDLIPLYLDAIAEHRVAYIFGYTSSLHSLALEANRLGRRDIRLRVAITNAEPLYPHQRSTISEAFGCPVRETYGMSELVAGGSECDAGRLHLWPEMGVVEVIDDERPVRPGETGDLVCTGLLTPDMPLIRYRVGDRGALADPDGRCPCGRTLPLLAAVEGRIDDLLYTVDGRRIGRLDTVFKVDMPVREAQIVQEALDHVRVRYVPTGDYTPSTGAELVARLRERMGHVQVTLEAVDEVPRTSAGKFRAVVCAIPPGQRPSSPSTPAASSPAACA